MMVLRKFKRDKKVNTLRPPLLGKHTNVLYNVCSSTDIFALMPSLPSSKYPRGKSKMSSTCHDLILPIGLFLKKEQDFCLLYKDLSWEVEDMLFVVSPFGQQDPLR